MAFATAPAADMAPIRPGILEGVIIAPEPLLGRLTAALARGGISVAGAAEPGVLPAESADRVVHYGVIACDRLDGRARSAARRLRDWWSGVRVVAVVHAGDANVAEALAAGFDGLLFVSDADAALAATVRGVCAGQFVAPRAAFRFGRRPVLSAAEHELLRMVVDGLTNAQIAARLDRGESTIKARLSALFAKLGVRSRRVAAAAVLEGRLNGSPVELGRGAPRARERSTGSAAALVGDDATLHAIWAAAGAAGLQITDAAADAPALVRTLRGREVDVVVAACLDQPARVEWVRALRDTLPSATLILIVAPAACRPLRALAEAGADACILLPELEPVLEVAVAGARAGRVSVPHSVRGRLECPALSYREREVLAWAVCGAANRQIAARLFVSESTVKSHLVSAFAKLDVHSRAEAAELVLDPHNGIEIGVADIVGKRPTEVNRAA